MKTAVTTLMVLCLAAYATSAWLMLLHVHQNSIRIAAVIRTLDERSRWLDRVARTERRVDRIESGPLWRLPAMKKP